MQKQFHFYLNDEKITDSFLIRELAKENNLSGLVKGLLYDYYKTMKIIEVEQEHTTNINSNGGNLT